MHELKQFKSEVRAWLEANCPESMRQPYRSEVDVCWGGRNWKFQSDDQQAWLQRMAEKGWTAPSWPIRYGGGGLDREHAKILKQELKRIDARAPLYSFGISMIGPALLKYGSEELKMQHLPPIVRGEIRWVQGYSEPNAGSDLASLQARADDLGDHYIVNGSKIWTSYGDQGDWMFVLIRTDPQAPKHQGISLILFDMNTPGVTTRPILLISGKSPFTETFFENTRMEKNQVVGAPNQGWTIAKYLLTHEREMIGEVGNLQSGAELLSRVAVTKLGLDNGRLSNPVLRTDIARFEIDEVCHQLTMERARDEAHRFGITFHRDWRRRRNLRSSLEDLSGVGKTRARTLLRAFGSLRAMRKASEEEIAGVPGVPRGVARSVYEFLRLSDAEVGESPETSERSPDDRTDPPPA